VHFSVAANIGFHGYLQFFSIPYMGHLAGLKSLLLTPIRVVQQLSVNYFMCRSPMADSKKTISVVSRMTDKHVFLCESAFHFLYKICENIIYDDAGIKCVGN
jgi:hypothetical protein